MLTDLEQTFVPLIRKKRYNDLNAYFFKSRDVIDLGAGPLNLMYKHAILHGAATYTAVDKNPEYITKLNKKLANETSVVWVVRSDLLSFLDALLPGKNLTIICSGIVKDFVRPWRRTEGALLEKIQKGVRYLGIASEFFLDEELTTGKRTSDKKLSLYTYQNGDNLLVAQRSPLPEKVCVKTRGILPDGDGRSFGKYDHDFPVPAGWW